MDSALRHLRRRRSETDPEQLAHWECRVGQHVLQPSHIIQSRHQTHAHMDAATCQCGSVMWEGDKLCEKGHHRYVPRVEYQSQDWLMGQFLVFEGLECLRCKDRMSYEEGCSQNIHHWKQREHYRECLRCEHQEPIPCEHEDISGTVSGQWRCVTCRAFLSQKTMCQRDRHFVYHLIDYMSQEKPLCTVLGCEKSGGKDLHDLEWGYETALFCNEKGIPIWEARRKRARSGKGGYWGSGGLRPGKILLSPCRENNWQPATRKQLKELRGGWFLLDK